MITKQSGIATIAAVVLIVGAVGLGMWFKHFTDHVDHPAEQAAEDILDDYGIDIDFSEDKKETKATGK